MPPTTKKSLNIFVTGFGPFPTGNGGMFDRNASHLITQILPSSLPPSHPLNPTDCHINLVNPTAAEGQYIKTEYAYIRTYISDLHDEHKDDIDLFLHLGMAAGWDFVSIEQKGYRQDFSWGWGSDEKQELYRIKDAAGKTVLDAPVLPWASRVPFGLIGTLDPITMAERANKSLEGARKSDNEETPGSGGKEKSHGLSVKIHSDPGSYCCGFTYYESLANKYAKGTRGHVMFCHVPEETDQESLEKARDTVLAIIGAAAEEMTKEKNRSPRYQLM